MSPYDYIKHRQVLWAHRHHKPLGGQFRNDTDPAQVERGTKLFTLTLDDNLFEPLGPEARGEFESGDGDELESKMNAVHSSSALAVNLFNYWRQRELFSEIAKAIRVPSTGITGIRFEAQFPIHSKFSKAPNIDVVIEYAPFAVLKATAVECKFNEPFGGRGKRGLKPVYLNHDEFWTELPHLRAIAAQVSPENNRFVALDAPQLIKHCLGLKKAYGKRGFRLVYLYYDVLGPEGVRHSEEVAEFSKIMAGDGVTFQSLTYQDVILSLARNQRVGHEAFVDYLAERYL